MNYTLLRETGVEYIRALCSKIWTDYNAHDPGITILEALCYSLTDCGYRTGFDMKDLVARLPANLKKDFYTARQILTCNPTTILDLKKFIIDQEGVQNAWLYKHYYDDTTTDPWVGQPEFWYECDDNTKAYEIRVEKEAGDAASLLADGYTPKYLNGLYNVMLQLEEDEEFGDLNANVVEWMAHKAGNINQRKKIKVVFPVVSVRYPCWDYPLGDIINYDTITNAQVTNYTVTDGQITLDYTISLEDSGTGNTIDITWEGVRIEIDTTSNPAVNLVQADIENELEDLTTAGIPLLTPYLYKRFFKIISVIKDVYCALHRVRNLCEDYVTFSIVPQQEILLCADIEVELTADLEEVLAEIYYRVDKFLAPKVRFYNLLEMYEKGKRTEEIFLGPRLDHGFIIEEELAECELKTVIHTSDLYNIIMAIPGVTKIKKLQITNYLNGEPQTEGELWCLELGGAYSLNLSKDSSSVIHFYKDGLLFFADTSQAEMIVRSLQAQDSKPKFTSMENDLAVPTGRYRNLKEYYSIQNDLPEVYKTGKNGITEFDDSIHRSQVKQLKAFLLFFDQVLVNYFGQLDAAKDLLSLDKTLNVTQTYATEPVYDTDASVLPDFYHVQNLLQAFTSSMPAGTDWDDEKSYKTQWDLFTANPANGYITGLKSITETAERFYERRNLFIDHLLARFAETFGDYAYVMHKMFGNKSEQDLIDDKLSFLYDYPRLSYERGKAFTYKCCDSGEEEDEPGMLTDGWPADNISGLQRRVARLLGFNDPTDRMLVPLDRDFTKFPAGAGFSRYEFKKSGTGPVLLMSKAPHFTNATYNDSIFKVIELAADTSRYIPVGLSFELQDKSGNVYAIPNIVFANAGQRQVFIENMAAYFIQEYYQEGMHLIEHILLRPVDDVSVSVADVDEGYFPECKLHDDCDCPIADHYSFRITIALPYWPTRFRNMTFRTFSEKLIRYETPAHILAKICWVSIKDMYELEKVYAEWLALECEDKPDRTDLSEAIEALMKKINNLTNVYPQGVLHDCTTPSDDESIILGQSALGTFEDVEDES